MSTPANRLEDGHVHDPKTVALRTERQTLGPTLSEGSNSLNYLRLIQPIRQTPQRCGRTLLNDGDQGCEGLRT